MDLIFYDFETTGRDPHWDQILQVGATKVPREFNEIDSFEVRCRLKPGLIPSPFALAVNHTDYSRLIKPIARIMRCFANWRKHLLNVAFYIYWLQ